MEEIVLLIGNGINRLSNSGPSWLELLNQIQKNLNNSIDTQNDFKPFPMAFEEIVMTNCDNYLKRLKGVKQSISEALLEMKPNKFHKRIVESKKINHIITTNYDYSFEKVLFSSFSNKNSSDTKYITKENKYSLRRRNLIDTKSVWHIHGEIFDPKNYQSEKRHYKEESIMLGYEHYSEYLKIMQDYKNGRNKWAKTPLKVKLSESLNLEACWINFFFTKHIIIIGLDLGFSEIDLWWLLNFRARVLKEYPRKKDRPIQIRESKITFVFPVFSNKSIKEIASQNSIKEERIKRDIEKSRARAEILKAFEVETEEISSSDYESFYNLFLQKYNLD